MGDSDAQAATYRLVTITEELLFLRGVIGTSGYQGPLGNEIASKHGMPWKRYVMRCLTCFTQTTDALVTEDVRFVIPAIFFTDYASKVMDDVRRPIN